ncbi:hypothetical protein NEIELOOT_02030 [Neisseria elongata subsp. glycolytica ATCC 29315]|uniref:Uncharacterized protein n=1 Tax=Neisseria elongata subsp. glycolytica ATCC 29315 TaxID=546263 RepID=D4DSI5_NEIEG|nr:hypothetical protein NEIELOOT_02030 [Neisseria elongata subsp. glycolytica ATCC 29315]
MTAKRSDSQPIRASGLILRGDTAHRFKTQFAASVSFVRRRQLLPKLAAAFAPPQRRKLYQLLPKFIPV